MKRAILWTLLGTFVLGLLVLVLAGPKRLWGLFGTEACEGTVTSIQPAGQSDEDAPSSYLVELRTDQDRIHMFRSSDRQWMLVTQGDRVRARLFPAPPWSTNNGLWQNGLLLVKFPPPPAPPVKLSKDKDKPLVSLSSLGASLLMMLVLVRSDNARTLGNVPRRVRRTGGLSKAPC